MALDGVRQAPVETGTHGAAVLAKLRDDGLLALLHDEEAGAQPDQCRDADNEARTNAGGLGAGVEIGHTAATGTVATTLTTALFAQQATELAVEVAPQLVEIWRTLVGPLTSRALRRTVVVVAFGLLTVLRSLIAGCVVAPAPAWIVQVEHAQQLAQDLPWLGA
ncbi:hypothetical protein D9M68_845590 [compost metagenome]